jgi:hypothetical protein
MNHHVQLASIVSILLLASLKTISELSSVKRGTSLITQLLHAQYSSKATKLKMKRMALGQKTVPSLVITPNLRAVTQKTLQSQVITLSQRAVSQKTLQSQVIIPSQ